MPKTANINLRIEPDIKAPADAVFSSLGISVTNAINVFLHASIMEGGFPFQPKQPLYNRETVMAMQEARGIMSGKVEADRKLQRLLTPKQKPICLIKLDLPMPLISPSMTEIM